MSRRLAFGSAVAFLLFTAANIVTVGASLTACSVNDLSHDSFGFHTSSNNGGECVLAETFWRNADGSLNAANVSNATSLGVAGLSFLAMALFRAGKSVATMLGLAGMLVAAVNLAMRSDKTLEMYLTNSLYLLVSGIILYMSLRKPTMRERVQNARKKVRSMIPERFRREERETPEVQRLLEERTQKVLPPPAPLKTPPAL